MQSEKETVESQITKISPVYQYLNQEVWKYIGRTFRESELTKVVEEIQSNSPVTHTIELFSNHLGDTGITLLGDSLKVNRTIHNIAIHWNNIGDIGAISLAETFKVNSSITNVDLGMNNIGDIGAIALAEMFKVNSSITKLYLRMNNIGDIGFKELAAAFQHNSTIMEIDFSYNQIGDIGVKELAEAFKTNKSIHSVKLDNNKINDNGAIHIAEALKVNNTVNILSFNHNQIGDNGILALAEALEINTSIHDIVLQRNRFGVLGMTAFGEVFKRNFGVHTLNLSENMLQDAGTGTFTLAESLKVNETLHTLKLGNSNINNDGITALAEALSENSTIQTLELHGNHIGDIGAIALAEALKRNNTIIHTLILASNFIGDTGMMALADAFQLNRSLHTVVLLDNNITHLPAVLAQNQTLTSFDCSSNPIVYAPPSVERWLNRFQNESNNKIFQDSQNVHNVKIQQSVFHSLNRIMNLGPPYYKNIEEVLEVIVNDSILSQKCKETLLHYANDKFVHSRLQLTFGETLCYVFSRIKANPNGTGDEIKSTLNQEMEDSLCKCFTGRITRLLNSLNGFDPLVEINLSDNAMVANICSQIYELLAQGEDNENGEGKGLTRENYQTRVETELQDRGIEITDRIQEDYINPILLDL